MTSTWDKYDEDEFSGGTLELECDTCGDTEFFDDSTFTEALEAAKADGWRAYMEGGEWKHKCPDCMGGGS